MWCEYDKWCNLLCDVASCVLVEYTEVWNSILESGASSGISWLYLRHTDLVWLLSYLALSLHGRGHSVAQYCCIVLYFILLYYIYGISTRSCMTNVTLTVQSNRNNTPCFVARSSAHYECGIFLYKIKKLNIISSCISASFSRTNRHSSDHRSLWIRQQNRCRHYSCD